MLFTDVIEDADAISFFTTAGIVDTVLNGGPAAGVWERFRTHYTVAGRIDEGRVARDFARWPPIAARAAELRSE